MTRVLHASLACLVATALMVAVVVGAGDSALTKAVKAGDIQAARALIKQGADVNAKSGDGSTPLLWAADGGAHEIARALIAAKAKVDVATDLGVTPLLQAARIGDATMVDILLRAGANPSLAHPDGETPLMAASRSGNVAAVKALLARGAKVNDADKFQSETALMWAAAQGHVDVAGVLLEAGADPNKQAHATSLATRKNADHPTGGFTALMWAARNGNESMVRRLAKGGANLNLKNGDGATAMMIAIWNDRFDMAATLAELGADVNDGSLYVAVEMRDSTNDQFAFDGSRRRPDNPNKLTALDLMKILLDKGADPNIADATGMAALYAAVDMNTLGWGHGRPDPKPHGELGSLDIVRILLARGADPNAKLKSPKPQRQHTAGDAFLGAGATPLMRATKAGDVAVMRMLVEYGADPFAELKDGVTLLMIASGMGWRGGFDTLRDSGTEQGAIEAIKFCLEYGHDLKAVNAKGQTALHGAIDRGPSVLEYLVRAGADLHARDKQGRTPLEIVSGIQARAGLTNQSETNGTRQTDHVGSEVRQRAAAVLRRLEAEEAARTGRTEPAPEK